MATPLFMRDAKLTLKVVGGAGSRVPFECETKLAEVVTNAGDSVEYKTLCTDGSYKSVGASTYDLHVVAAQDWSTTGLARFLWDNEGSLAEFQYQAHSETDPPTAETPGMAGVVQLVGPSYGGERDTYAELDVTMPCQTRPTLTTAAFPTVESASEEEELVEVGA